MTLKNTTALLGVERAVVLFQTRTRAWFRELVLMQRFESPDTEDIDRKTPDYARGSIVAVRHETQRVPRFLGYIS